MTPSSGFYQPGSRSLVSQSDRAIIEDAQVPRSKFTGSWTHKTTFDAGYLVPFLLDEVLPGDKLNYRLTAYVRMSTPLFPLFDNQRIDTFFFFVPCRLLWENWVRLMGEQTNPTDSIDYFVPWLQCPAGGYDVGSLMDHFGLPTVGQTGAGLQFLHNVLPLRAYNFIWNLWFRDQNIVAAAPFTTADGGGDAPSQYVLRRRAKSHDYFTSALPWAQKFTPPSVPLGGLAPIIGLGTLAQNASTGPQNIYETGGPRTVDFYAGNATNAYQMEMSAAAGGLPLVYADLSAATGVAINTFRQAYMVQSLLERDARGGTRYVELIRSHFRVTNPDFRLQRPEYIGGGQTPLQLTPVAQTAPSAGTPVGALGAAGTAAGQHSASYAATEHGYIIGLINVRSELSYQQGLHKMWSRSTRYDFYWPALAGLGEQAILRKEIYAIGDPLFDDLVFGYQERWQEYRTRYSEVTAMFRSTAVGTLDAWHLAQKFDPAPTLSQAFIEDTPDMGRVLAADELAEGQEYLADLLIERTAVRPIPMFGTPVTLGRF